MRRKRGRMTLLILFPLGCFIWMVGWTLHCVGPARDDYHARDVGQSKTKTPKQ